jgi:hypothetical protein
MVWSGKDGFSSLGVDHPLTGYVLCEDRGFAPSLLSSQHLTWCLAEQVFRRPDLLGGE